MTDAPDVHVRIARVRVPRSARAGAPALALAVERELARLLRRAPAPTATDPITLSLDAPLALPPGASPAAVARALARQAHRELTRTAR